MNTTILVWSYLKAKPLNAVLNIILLSTGIAVITILILFTNQLENKITDNSRGIDLVVGAKGSPLQIILCNIFHMDFPTGNIKLWEAEKIARNRLVRKAIPVALGDSYHGFRIIGTSVDYANLYEATLREGQWWNKELEVTLGSNVAMSLDASVGMTFLSTHAFAEEGHQHEGDYFRVTGILLPTNSVLDNLILTNVESIWRVHEGHLIKDSSNHLLKPGSERYSLVPSVSASDSTKEITSLLLQYRSAMGAVQLPRIINGQTNLQAASPAFESARLFSILGVGVDALTAFAYVIIFISALSIFIALYNALKERRYDMAIMRTMGATRGKIVSLILLEGCLLSAFGAMVGMFLGHAVVYLLSVYSVDLQKTGITSLIFFQQEWIILAGSLLLGLLCSVIPAYQVYQTDISKILAGN